MGKIASISVLFLIASACVYILSWIILSFSVFGYNLFPLTNIMNIASKTVFAAFGIILLYDFFMAPKLAGMTKEPIKYEKIDGKKISVVMPAYNEENGIESVVRDFFAQKNVAEVVVIDNGSTDSTGKLAKKAGARVVRVDPNRGFGGGSYLALQEAKNDVIVLIESDSTHKGADLKKLLPYLENVDMVVGTRTTYEFINPGAKMDWFMGWGNIFISKLLQIRFQNKTRLTDAGCVYRAIKKDAFKKIEHKLKIFDNTFGSYMILVALQNNLKIVEVPISYNPRVGESKNAAKNRWIAFKLGLRMIWRIISA
jgi:glycosyltransferase involved in cell wall biosynthesis